MNIHPRVHVGYRGWTWEHVIPRTVAKTLRLGAGRPSKPGLKLLACYPCNHAKSASPPSDDHLAEALLCAREWFSLDQNNKSGMHPKGSDTLAELEWLVESYKQSYKRIVLCLAVPDTVEEAIAQGGIGPLEAALGRTIPRSYASDPAWREATAAALGVTDPGYLPSRKLTR